MCQALPTRRMHAAGAAAFALTLLLTAAAPGTALANNLRMKGSPKASGPGDEVSEKYLSALDKKKLQNSRRKAALAKQCAPDSASPAASDVKLLGCSCTLSGRSTRMLAQSLAARCSL